MDDNAMLAPCGIDCSECEIFVAARDPAAAEHLAEQWRSWNPKAEASWFRCQGCRGDRSVRWTEDCAIAACAEEKGIRFCSECGEFPCKRLEDWAAAYPHHQKAFDRLVEMRGTAKQ